MLFNYLGQHVSTRIESSSGPFKMQIVSKDPYIRRAWRWLYKSRNVLP